MKNILKLSAFILTGVMTIGTLQAQAATGVCELLEGTTIDTSLFNFSSSANYSGGRRTYGNHYSKNIEHFTSDDPNGSLDTAISLRDDTGKVHTLSGDIEVVQMNMMRTPDGTSYVCLEINTKEDVLDFAFQIASGYDIADTPVLASTSGRGYGIRLLSEGEDKYYTMAKSQCTYSRPAEHICITDDHGRQRCHDRQVERTTSCRNGETETNYQGREINFGITNTAGKVIGTFSVIK